MCSWANAHRWAMYVQDIASPAGLPPISHSIMDFTDLNSSKAGSLLNIHSNQMYAVPMLGRHHSERSCTAFTLSHSLCHTRSSILMLVSLSLTSLDSCVRRTGGDRRSSCWGYVRTLSLSRNEIG
jgi:hypothetical protein